MLRHRLNLEKLLNCEDVCLPSKSWTYWAACKKLRKNLLDNFRETPCVFIKWALPHRHGSNHFHALISMMVEDEVGKSEENDQNSEFKCLEQECSQAILHWRWLARPVAETLGAQRATTLSSTGRVFVHEWAHLRWGVFDEYSKDKPFYLNGRNEIQVTRSVLSYLKFTACKWVLLSCPAPSCPIVTSK